MQKLVFGQLNPDSSLSAVVLVSGVDTSVQCGAAAVAAGRPGPARRAPPSPPPQLTAATCAEQPAPQASRQSSRYLPRGTATAGLLCPTINAGIAVQCQ